MRSSITSSMEANNLIIHYKTKDNLARAWFNHTLFGRVQSVNRKGKKVAYYQTGILHEIPFKRLQLGEVFIDESIWNKYSEEELQNLLDTFGEIKFQQTNINFINVKTGWNYWKEKSEKRGYTFVQRNR